jgi:hypothetical protein
MEKPSHGKLSSIRLMCLGLGKLPALFAQNEREIETRLGGRG